jgi:hypothetical protein
MKIRTPKKKVSAENQRFFDSVAKAMKRVPENARKTARMYGTPIFVWENGKVVAKKP